MNPSFGSGGPLLGAPASAVMGMPTALQQQSPSSPGFQPGLLPPPPVSAPPAPQGFQPPQMSSVPGSSPVPNAMPQAPQAPVGAQTAQGGVVGIPPSNPEAMAIVKALSSRLASVSKGEEMQRNPLGQ